MSAINQVLASVMRLCDSTKFNTSLSNDSHRFICFYTTCKTLHLSVFNKDLLTYCTYLLTYLAVQLATDAAIRLSQ